MNINKVIILMISGFLGLINISAAYEFKGKITKVEIAKISQVARTTVHKFIDKMPNGTSVVCYLAVSEAGTLTSPTAAPVLNCIKQAE